MECCSKCAYKGVRLTPLPVIIGSDNGPPPVRRQAITRTNIDLLSIVPLETNVS